MIKTDNPIHLLVQLHDSIRWMGGWLDLAQAENRAFLSWAHFDEAGDNIQAAKYREKYLKLSGLQDKYPDWEDKYQWSP